MLDTKLLRKRILELAFSGELIKPQEKCLSANSLYKYINEIYTKLVAEKVIKKIKKLSPIEENEKEHDIPSNWEYVRFGTVINLLSGVDLKPSEYSDSPVGIPYITGASNVNNGKIVINRWTAYAKNIARVGDLLLTCKGTVGKIAILEEPEVHIARQLMAIQNYAGLNIRYIKYFIEFKLDYLISESQGLIPGIDRNCILSLVFPLAPIDEQNRIVEKIEQIFTILDSIDKNMESYELEQSKLNQRILEAAIQGKLVEQRAEEGSAEELYNHIWIEKQEFIVKKIIKKDKALDPVTNDEIPFKIPETWKWVRLGDVCNIINGFTPKRTEPSYWATSDVPWFTIDDIRLQGRRITKTEQAFSFVVGDVSKRIIPPNTVLLCCTASVGEYAITEISLTTNQQFNGLVIKDSYSNFISSEYIFCIAPLFKETLLKMSGKMTIDYISVAKLANMLIPVPPYKEQERIVNKIQQLSSLCDSLIK